MALQARAAMAFSAMKAIGIPQKRVKPVLKNLLKLCEKNWELIEDENYRILADAIFEYEAEEANKKKESDMHGESPSRPLKRLRLKYQDDCASSSWEISSRRQKVEENGQLQPDASEKSCQIDSEPTQYQMNLRSRQKEVPFSQDCATQESEEPSQLNLRNRRNEPEHDQSQIHVRDKGKKPLLSPQGTMRLGTEEDSQLCFNNNRVEAESLPVSHPSAKRKESLPPQVAAREKKTIAVRPPSAVCLKEPKNEPDIFLSPKENLTSSYSFIKPKSEPFTGDFPELEVPISVIHPPASGPTNNGDTSDKVECSMTNDVTGQADGLKASGSMDKSEGTSITSSNNRMNLELANVPETSACNFEIASSPAGEVKISLSYYHGSDQSEIHMPSFDELLKMAEDKCLRSYKTIEPNFSLTKLMKDLCQIVLDLSNDSTCNKQESSSHLMSNGDIPKNASVKVAAKGCDDHENFVQPETSPSEVAVHKLRRMLSLNALDDLEKSQHIQKVAGNVNCQDKEDEFQTSSSTHNLVAAPESKVAADDTRPLHDVNDISKGEERIRVSLINEVSSEPYPPSFYYIPRNIVYQSAFVNFSLARIGDEDCCSDCFGDCLSSSIPCACARETGGEFAYTLQGLVKEKLLDEYISTNRDPQQHQRFYCNSCPLGRSKNGLAPDPCKGHLMRKFIKECWSKCGCSKLCGNRVVQRGITCNLQVFLTSEGKGWGLRTLEDLPRGTFVCEYVGEILTIMELHQRSLRSKRSDKEHFQSVLLDADWGSQHILKDEEALCLDATQYGNVGRFINHRCFDANLVEIPVEIETPNHRYYHVAFFTTRNVVALEELTWDYGINFDDQKHSVNAFQCQCGSKCCRDMKRLHRAKGKALVLG